MLRSGQTARVGRTEWADFSIPDDELLGDLQFAVRCDGNRCLLKNLLSSLPLFVNDEEVEEGELHDGDTIGAGSTKFAIAIEGVFLGAASGDDDSSDASNGQGKDVATRSVPSICKLAELDEEALELASDEQTPENYLDVLAAQGRQIAAIKFLAQWLSKREAVWWSAECVRSSLGDQLTPDRVAALDAAENWAKDPSEEHCRTAAQIAAANGHKGPSSWAALGASWSGKSLAPVGMPDVPPPAGLTGKAASGALLMAATSGPHTEIQARYEEFIQQGLAILKHEVELPES